MKNVFYTATLAALFLGIATVNVNAKEKVKPASSSTETDRDCNGLTTADCQSADAKSPRDATSGQATGKRQHKPVNVSEAKPMEPSMAAPSSSPATGEASASSAPDSSGIAEGQPASTDHVIATKGVGTVIPPRDTVSPEAAGKYKEHAGGREGCCDRKIPCCSPKNHD